MKTLYKDNNIEVIEIESFEDNIHDHNFCTKIKTQYDFHTIKLGQTLYRFIYSDGYIMGLGFNKLNMTGQWIDTVINENNKPTYILIKGNPFEFDVNKFTDKNSINLVTKILEIPNEIKLLSNFKI